MIFSPALQTLYYASSGNGAFRLSPADGGSPRRLPLAKRPAPLPSLKMAVVAVEWGSDRKRETIEKKTKAFATLCGDADAGVEGGRMVQGECAECLPCFYISRASQACGHSARRRSRCRAWPRAASTCGRRLAAGPGMSVLAQSLCKKRESRLPAPRRAAS